MVLAGLSRMRRMFSLLHHHLAGRSSSLSAMIQDHTITAYWHCLTSATATAFKIKSQLRHCYILVPLSDDSTVS
ncbi:hypothetical protein N7519_003363 [Penicillium mononematosum]|uniref:uncharacterized protein n=1 Tax=Penicillium mononematosum TaxID=268346 RepID=UPI0025481A99|nr:uncharacterized protein N7519_003363 [Penicillium mononematosum]KAJ6188455.1 hypothetical protein N7519_003363 [Penicillium mononematosum]